MTVSPMARCRGLRLSTLAPEEKAEEGGEGAQGSAEEEAQRGSGQIDHGGEQAAPAGAKPAPEGTPTRRDSHFALRTTRTLRFKSERLFSCAFTGRLGLDRWPTACGGGNKC